MGVVNIGKWFFFDVCCFFLCLCQGIYLENFDDFYVEVVFIDSGVVEFFYLDLDCLIWLFNFMVNIFYCYDFFCYFLLVLN